MNTASNPLFALVRSFVARLTPATAQERLSAYLGQADSLPQLEHMQRELARNPGPHDLLAL